MLSNWLVTIGAKTSVYASVSICAMVKSGNGHVRMKVLTIPYKHRSY